jgi:hypothetical protein
MGSAALSSRAPQPFVDAHERSVYIGRHIDSPVLLSGLLQFVSNVDLRVNGWQAKDIFTLALYAGFPMQSRMGQYGTDVTIETLNTVVTGLRTDAHHLG